CDVVDLAGITREDWRRYIVTIAGQVSYAATYGIKASDSANAVDWIRHERGETSVLRPAYIIRPFHRRQVYPHRPTVRRVDVVKVAADGSHNYVVAVGRK